MKKSIKLMFLILIVMSIPVLCFSETIQLGLNYGTSIINWPVYSSVNLPQRSYSSIYDLYIPKTLSLSFGIKLPFGMMIRPTIGYGRASSSSEIDRPGTTFTYTDYDNSEYEISINQYNERLEARINGLSVDLGFLFPIAVDAEEKFIIYPGIGVGYHYYGYSGEYDVNWTETDYYGNKDYYSVSGDYAENTLSGVCQTFILGFEVRPAGWLGFSLEFIKMGFSAISEEYDQIYKDFDERNNDYREIISKKIGTEKYDYNTSAGLTDIAVIFGTKINL